MTLTTLLRSIALASALLIGGSHALAAAPASATKGVRVVKHAGSCHGYLAVDDATKQAVLIDAPTGSAKKFLGEIKRKNLTVKAILLTHSHGDHTADLAKLHAATGAPILHRATKWGVSRPGMQHVEDDAIVEAGSLRLHVMHLPGHSDDSIGFYAPAAHGVFTGDTLQAGAMGGSDTDQTFLRSLHRLSLLPSDTHLYAGHGEASTIGQEDWMLSVIESEAPHLLE